MDPRRRFSVLLGVIALVAVAIMYFWGGANRASRQPEPGKQPAPVRQVKNDAPASDAKSVVKSDKQYDGLRLSRPLADLVEAVPADVDVLAVRDDEGNVYCTDVKDGKARLCVLNGETVEPIWTTKSKDGRRMDLAGVRGDELVVVFHNGLAYTSPLEAWKNHDTFYGIHPSAPSTGVFPRQGLDQLKHTIVADLEKVEEVVTGR